MGSAERLRLLRRAYRQRSTGRSRADVAYGLYLVAVILVPVGTVVARAVIMALSSPAVLGALQTPEAAGVAGVALGLVLAGMGWLGGVYGPVTLAPASVVLWAGTDLPRHHTLARRFGGWAVLVALVFAAVAALPVGVLVSTGGARGGAGVVFVAAAAIFGLVAAVVWLAGQAVEPRRLWMIPTGIMLLTLFSAVVPPVRGLTPWGWLSAMWPTSPHDGAWVKLTLLVAVAAIGLWQARALLDRLTLPRLVAAGHRWRSATTAAFTGDVADALGQFRTQPSVGRRWRAVRGGPLIVMFLLRDLIGTMRTPARSALAIASLACACLVVTLAGSHQLGWAIAAAGAGLGYMALGVFSDGFRHATDTAAAPALYGLPAGTLLLLHGALPLLATVIAILLAELAAGALGVSTSALSVVLTLLIIIAARAFDSARGFLPPILLTPVITPLGDLSALNIAAWQADALLISITTAAAIAALASTDTGAVAIALTATTIALLLLGLRHRLARL